MDIRRGVLSPEQPDFPYCWIPKTPGGPLLVPREHGPPVPPIVNWLKPVVDFSPRAACSGRTVQEGACQIGSSGSASVAGRMLDLNSCEAAAAAAASQGGVSGCVSPLQAPAKRDGATQEWWDFRYSDLVTMVANADAPRSVGGASPAFVFENMRSDCQQPGAALLLNGRFMLSPELLNGSQSSSASCEAVAPPFAPVTPDKQKGTQDGQHLGSAGSVDGGETAIEGQDGAVPPPTFDPKGKSPLIQLQFDQGASGQIYFSLAGLPSQLQENETQEKTGQGVDQMPAHKPRRKKHRPKVVVEGKPARTPKPVTPKPATPKPAEAGERTPGKRKYVRRKGINSPLETSPCVLGGETIKLHAKRTRSARRHLDFSDEADKGTCQGTTNPVKVQVESIPEKNAGYSMRHTTGYDTTSTNVVNKGQGVDLNSSAGIALALNHSNNQVLDSYLKSLEILSFPRQPSRRELKQEHLKKLARMRDSRQAPDHECTTRSEIQGDCPTLESLSMSTGASNMLSRDENVRKNEWNTQNNHLNDDARPHKGNVVPADFTHAQTCKYNTMNGISEYPRDTNNHLHYFPETPKKRRTQKGQNVTFNEVVSLADAQRILEFQRLRAMESKQASGQTDEKTGKRSYMPIQCWNLAYPADNMKSEQLPAYPQIPQLKSKRETGIVHGPQACVEALAVDHLAKVRRKRRTKKGQTQDLSILSESHNIGNCYRAIVPYIQGKKVVHPLDEIIQKMKCLNINRDQEENKVQEKSALVHYVEHGMLVPFVGQFDPRKKSRPRAKVDLDQETNRVWKLLMGKDNDVIEGSDVDKEKWWEEERRVFRGRADSFIARMHLVQGDRRFSPWKGSVLDSVIGVFLTQNVSDHLSSSAFMSLAARFSHQSGGKYKETNCNKANTCMGQSAVCTVDLNMAEKGSNQQTFDHCQVVVHEARQMEEKEMHPPGTGIERGVHEARQMEEKEMHPPGTGIERGTSPYPDTFSTLLRYSQNLTEADHRRLFVDGRSSQNSAVSSQNSSDDAVIAADQLVSISESKSQDVHPLTTKVCNLESRTSFLQLLEIAESSSFQELYAGSNGRNSQAQSCNTPFVNILKHGCAEERSSSSAIPIEFNSLNTKGYLAAENAIEISNHEKSTLTYQNVSSSDSQAFMANLTAQCLSGTSTNTCLGLQEDRRMEIQKKEGSSCFFAKDIHTGSEALHGTQKPTTHQILAGSAYLQDTSGAAERFSLEDKEKCVVNKAVQENSKEVCSSSKDPIGEASSAPRTKRGKSEKNKTFDWENLRRQACQNGAKKERSSDTMDSLDWEAVRNADVSEISNTIRERGMNNMLAERIKSFLDRLVKDHGSIDLEWLRDVPPDKAKDYLLSVRGLGLKSVECVRLLTLHHLAFPVDTNVGRICVRLGWVPLQPLPESLQLHLLELYPMLETIQKYLWPRLCTLDQRTLYELHYQMITFGKVFCTKSKPNCNACPMRGECKHFASAFASARLALPGPEEKCLVTATMDQNHKTVTNPWPLPQLEGNSVMQQVHVGGNCEPIIEEPETPEPECPQILDIPDIEDSFCEDPDEIPTIKLDAKEFAQNLQNYMEQNNMELQNVDWSKALVMLTPEAASIPMPKLKNVSRLRTEHQVYELPDSHPLLEGLDLREPQDPCPYLLAIWTPGETAQSTEPPESCSSGQGAGSLCDKRICFSCNSIREAQAQTVRGTLLIPCRTAMRGSFPLNGTYFQVNEVFADHESSLNPIDVPRALIWNLSRRTVYFGTSVPSIFRGLAIENIRNCFWRGFVCVRGFDRRTRGPRPLMARLHFPASKSTKDKKPATKADE